MAQCLTDNQAARQAPTYFNLLTSCAFSSPDEDWKKAAWMLPNVSMAEGKGLREVLKRMRTNPDYRPTLQQLAIDVKEAAGQYRGARDWAAPWLDRSLARVGRIPERAWKNTGTTRLEALNLLKSNLDKDDWRNKYFANFPKIEEGGVK